MRIVADDQWVSVPELTALEFPDITPSTDSAELLAFKEKVRLAAAKHSRNHHCGSIKTEMRELGIVEEKKVKVTVKTNHPFTFVVSVAPSSLAGKTAAEQAVVLAGLIGQVNLTVTGNVSAVGLQAITITPETVVGMSREMPATNAEPGIAGIEMGPRDGWRYVSDNGRVQHLYRNLYHGDGSMSTYYVSAVCSGGNAYGRELREESARGTGGYCATCTKIANGTQEPWRGHRG